MIFGIFKIILILCWPKCLVVIPLKSTLYFTLTFTLFKWQGKVLSVCLPCKCCAGFPVTTFFMDQFNLLHDISYNIWLKIWNTARCLLMLLFPANLDKPEPLRIWHSGKFTESARKGQVTKLQSTEGGSLFIHSLKKKTRQCCCSDVNFILILPVWKR